MSSLLLPEHLVDFVEGGTSKLVGTADRDLRPEAVRAVGAQVAADRASITIFVPELTGRRTRANVEAGSKVALTFCRVSDLRTLQVKGRASALRSEPDAARITQRYLDALAEAFYGVGMARAVTQRLRVVPAFVMSVSIDELYDQTPGPSAGERVVPEAFR